MIDNSVVFLGETEDPLLPEPSTLLLGLPGLLALLMVRRGCARGAAI